MSEFCHSVKTLNSPHSGYLNQQITNQDTPAPSYPLSNCSISQLPSTDEPEFPEFDIQDGFDEISSSDFTNEPVVDLTSTGSQRIAQSLLCSVATVWPLDKDKQQHPVLNETVRSKATESCDSGESVPLTLEKVHISGTGYSSQAKDSASNEGKRSRATKLSSDKRKVSLAKYAASNEGKKTRARRLSSDKGKATNARYAASVSCKVSQAKYAQSDGAKKARARYLSSDKGKAALARYAASDRGKLSLARYAASEKGKARLARYAASYKGKVAHATKNAKSLAYRAALRQGFCEEIARGKGESAANAMKAELSSATGHKAEVKFSKSAGSRKDPASHLSCQPGISRSQHLQPEDLTKYTTKQQEQIIKLKEQIELLEAKIRCLKKLPAKKNGGQVLHCAQPGEWRSGPDP